MQRHPGSWVHQSPQRVDWSLGAVQPGGVRPLQAVMVR